MNGNSIAKVILASIAGLGTAWYIGYIHGFNECKMKVQQEAFKVLAKSDRNEKKEAESKTTEDAAE